MADDTTKIIISIESVLRNLDKTLRGLDQVKKKLDAVAQVKFTQQSSQSADKAAVAAQRLALQQQRLNIQTTELANRQARAQQTTERLAQAQQRLTVSQQRLDQGQLAVSRSAGLQADAHVKAFKALQQGFADTNKHVEFFRANEQALAKAPQLDAHVRAFRALQKGVDDADAHVQFFKAREADLARAPQLDSHVQAFRALEAASKKSADEQERARRSTIIFDQALTKIGISLRNLGQGLTAFGASLSAAITVPLTTLGVLSTRNAVTLDSLKRGLTAITGSADEAGRQMARLTEIAKLPGIGFQEAIQGSIRLQAVGFSAEKAEKALVQFSNAVALTGGGREELERITVQLGQLSAKGKVLSQDLRPIIEAGPAVGRALKQAFGTVNADDIQALGLSSEEFLDRLVTQLGKLPRAAAGLKNTFDNFSDSLFRATSAIGEAIVPALTKLIDIAEPIITQLAAGFKSLPPFIQTVIVGFAGLGAAAGPALLIIGQFVIGIGGLVSAFGRLASLGIVPTIEAFQLLRQVMAGTASLAAGQAATTAAAAGGWIALGGAVTGVLAVLAVAGVVIASYVNSQKEAVKISKEQIAATDAQINTLKDQIDFIDGLNRGVSRTADEQDRLAQIYADLNTQAKIRVTNITDEERRLAGLREELQRLLKLRNEERVQQAANLAASLADTTQQIKASEQDRNAIADRIRANSELATTISSTNRITAEQSVQLARQGINASTAQDAIGALNAENESLIASQGQLINTSKELNGTAREQAEALRVMQQQTGLSTRELLSAAKAMGIFKGDVETTIAILDRFIHAEEKAAVAVDLFQAAIEGQTKDALKAGEEAESAQKRRKALIDANVALAKEASTSFEGATKFLRAFIAAQPELAAAIEKERQLAGKSFDEFVSDLLTKGQDKSASQLRNAREELAKQVLQVAEAQKEKELATEKAGNDKLLDENELAFTKQIIAYRQYLQTRAELTDAQLAKEQRAQLEIARDARAAQVRLLAAARSSRIPETERVKRQTQAGAQEEQALKAEAKAAEIEAQRTKNASDLKRALAEATIQQVKDVRQLDIEFAELDGRIEDALNTKTIERFREVLQKLSLSQDDLNKKLKAAKGNKAKEEEIKQAIALNQSNIDLIELIKDQEFATNKLAAANEFVRREKEKQSDLETQLTFDIEFRGLKEEDAIKRRLEGERKLADSLRVVRDLVQAEIDALNGKGVNPPQALLDFVRHVNAEIQGLGELSFGEQFRLVEKEFNRLNDERLSKIADIERAIRERDIAEAEGLLIIRRINGQYSADLEQQVDLLKQIAAQSGSPDLQRQAEAANQTAKDANAQLAGFNAQVRSTSIDALQQGFTDFFANLRDRTKIAKEKLLDLVNSVVQRIEQVIAENLSRKLIESLFGSGTEGNGILSSIEALFGFGGKGAQGGAGSVAAAGISQTTQATAAATALTTGATAAASALVTGGVTASTTLVTSLAAAAASFSAGVVAAGAAFAASVAAASAASGITQGIGGLGAGLGAATGMFPATPGGMVHIVEGGYDEAVLTTDPRHAARQVSILRELIQRTKGFYGHLPRMAEGGIVSRETSEAHLLNAINRTPSISPRIPDVALQASGRAGDVNLRIVNQVESRALARPYLTSEEGRKDVLNIISTSSNTVLRRLNR